MKHILALDQGTTSSRAIVFAEDGSVRALAQQEFRQIFPHPGWVEHDPEDIWASQLSVARRALAQARLKAKDIAALGIANQRETAIIWERKSGHPVHNAIVWQDRRTADACAKLKRRGKTQTVRGKTGLVIDPYFSATKLAWMLDGIPGLRLHAERGELAFGTVDSWLIWKLTGGSLHITDVSNAARTMLFNIHTSDWDDELLALFRIPRSLLPRVLPSSRAYGASAKAVFGAPVTIAGIGGDQQAALFGQACHKPGMAKNTYGTGCFMLLNTGARAVPSRHGLLTTRCAQQGSKPQYALEGGVFVAGAVVQWLRDGLGFIRSSAEIEALAASVEDTGGVYLVPAFAGLGAPHWDAYARGTMLGLTRGTTRAHIARAALEAIAFQSAEVLQSMQKDAGIRLTELRVDGGAAANDTLMQFQADILGVPVLRPKVLETTALGAAYLAGLAAGVWKSTAAISRQWAVGRRFDPAMGRGEAQARMAGWTRALERAKDWIER
ncbi:MAG: glycerol kinase GlpK [Burkholderiales bacterium]|nr:glycerol kinase GlpK [Burkholderiales bacterium]